MSEIAVLLGNRIREIRTSKHMSQEELAFKASINPAHLGQIERAQKNPTLDTIWQISNALGVPISELFSELSGPESNSPIEPHTTLIADKILLHVNRMSDYQQKELLRLIRILEHFNTKEENN